MVVAPFCAASFLLLCHPVVQRHHLDDITADTDSNWNVEQALQNVQFCFSLQLEQRLLHFPDELLHSCIICLCAEATLPRLLRRVREADGRPSGGSKSSPWTFLRVRWSRRRRKNWPGADWSLRASRPVKVRGV